MHALASFRHWATFWPPRVRAPSVLTAAQPATSPRAEHAMPSKKQRAKAKKHTKPTPPQRLALCFVCRKTQIVAHMNAHAVTIVSPTHCGKNGSFRTCSFLCDTCNTKDNIRLAKEMLRGSPPAPLLHRFG